MGKQPGNGDELERIPDYDAYKGGLHDASLEVETPDNRRLKVTWRGAVPSAAILTAAGIAALWSQPYAHITIPVALAMGLAGIVVLRRHDNSDSRAPPS